ncbi:GDP-L-fucose synthase family protein [Methylibium sp.]|uniref:GDP-L-fucose synthase family protein n=1 Tax=Methylibium sp. TaxID=2067992 RepID=UPI003D1276EF
MNKASLPEGPIYVAGHRGLVGSAILRQLQQQGYRDIVTATHQELDLGVSAQVLAFFAEIRPACVFLAAARVGGIWANSRFPADFIRENLAIQSNVIEAAYRFSARKLLFLGSSCIYPKLAPQPITEDALLSGPLEPTNEAYAIAKIAGIKTCSAYNRQYGTNFLSLMPTNLYGPGDNYDPQTSHVLPALIRRAHEAKQAGSRELVVWGSGTPRREFMHADDLAGACLFAMSRFDAGDVGECVNVGVGADQSIRELAELVVRIVGFEGRLVFDASKPDGTPRKLLDVSVMRRLGWTARIGLEQGIAQAYEDFLSRFGRPHAADAGLRSTPPR